VTILRHPVSRSVSGYFFRGHGPNWDRFHVRDEFLTSPPSGEWWTWPFSFEDYVRMPEYHNIITRMLSRDSFPYRDLEITQADLDVAKAKLDGFIVVGLNEAFATSIELLKMSYGFAAHGEIVGDDLTDPNAHLKSSAGMTKSIQFKRYLSSNHTLHGLLLEAERFDLQLYDHGRKIFCRRAMEMNLTIVTKQDGLCDAELFQIFADTAEPFVPPTAEEAARRKADHQARLDAHNAGKRQAEAAAAAAAAAVQVETGAAAPDP